MAEKKYFISFDTKEAPGRVVAVTVQLGKEYLPVSKDPLPINLADHPQYKELWTYCKNNPPRKD